MNPVARQSLLTTLSSYLGVVIGYFNVLWLLPYVLDPGQIGLYRTIQDMALLLVPVAQLGLGNGITRFFPLAADSKNSFLTFSLALAFLGFVLVSLIFWLVKQTIIDAFAANAPEVINFLWVVVFILLFSVLNSILDAVCRSFVKVAVPSFFREVVNRLLASILVGVYFFGWIDFEQMIGGMSLVYLISLVGITLYIKRLGLFRLDWNFGRIPQPIKTDFLKYSLITLLGTTGSMLIMKIDSLMVSSMIGLDANAIYTIAFSIAIVIELPKRAISQVAMPLVADHFANNDLPAIQKLYKEIATHQFLICLLLFLGIWSNIDSLYHFVPNKDIYEAGKWVVLWIGLSKLVDILFSINSEIIVFSKYYIFNITATFIMSIAVIGFNLLLIPQYGIEGAAFASFLAMLLYNVIKYFHIKIRMGFDPFSWDITKLLGLGFAVYFAQFYLFGELEKGIWDILVRSSFITVFYLAGVYGLKIAFQSQKQLIKKIKKLRS